MVVYLDNIYIFTQILEKHHGVVHKIIEFLTEYKQFLCPRKYEFDR